MPTLTTKREQLAKLVHDMQAYADECDGKEATVEELGRLIQMGRDVKALADEVRTEGEAHGELDDAKSFLAELAGRPDGAAGAGEKNDQRDWSSYSGIVNPKGMTLGEAFTKSPAYEDFVTQFRGADGRIRDVQNLKSAAFDVSNMGEIASKALVTGASQTSGGAFVINQVLPQYTTDLIGERELTIRDLVTVVPLGSDTFEYVTVTGKTNNAAGTAEATTEATPGLNNVAVGAYTSAHGVKPQSALTLAVVTSAVETISHWIPVTRRAAADSNQVRALVDAFLLYGLAEEEEDQILNGNGTSPNLRGIYQTSGVLTVGSAGTDIDAVVDAISAVRITGRRRPTGLVIHPADWYSTGFLTAKDSNGNYILGDPRASVDQLNTLWGLRVVVTEAATQNTALVGDFRYALLADREQSSIYVTDSHNDFFVRNILVILAEERVGFGVLDPEAFCTVTAV